MVYYPNVFEQGDGERSLKFYCAVFFRDGDCNQWRLHVLSRATVGAPCVMQSWLMRGDVLQSRPKYKVIASRRWQRAQLPAGRCALPEQVRCMPVSCSCCKVLLSFLMAFRTSSMQCA